MDAYVPSPSSHFWLAVYPSERRGAVRSVQSLRRAGGGAWHGPAPPAPPWRPLNRGPTRHYAAHAIPAALRQRRVAGPPHSTAKRPRISEPRT